MTTPKPKKKPLTWKQRIAYAKRRGEFSYDDWKAANFWVTCACGQQDRSLMTNLASDWSEPWDAELHRLGVQFGSAVRNGGAGFAKARKLLAKIDARAAFLLREIRNGKIDLKAVRG